LLVAGALHHSNVPQPGAITSKRQAPTGNIRFPKII
jgi:hypothetical protein